MDYFCVIEKLKCIFDDSFIHHHETFLRKYAEFV